jgi:hypothetical protein
MIVMAGHFCIKTGLAKYCSTGTSTKLVLYSSMVFFIHEVHIWVQLQQTIAHHELFYVQAWYSRSTKHAFSSSFKIWPQRFSLIKSYTWVEQYFARPVLMQKCPAITIISSSLQLTITTSICTFPALYY